MHEFAIHQTPYEIRIVVACQPWRFAVIAGGAPAELVYPAGVVLSAQVIIAFLSVGIEDISVFRIAHKVPLVFGKAPCAGLGRAVRTEVGSFSAVLQVPRRKTDITSSADRESDEAFLDLGKADAIAEHACV